MKEARRFIGIVLFASAASQIMAITELFFGTVLFDGNVAIPQRRSVRSGFA